MPKQIWSQELHQQIIKQTSAWGLNQHVSNWMLLVTILSSILLISSISLYLAKRYLKKYRPHKPFHAAVTHQVFNRVIYLIPALIIYFSIPLIEVSALSFTPMLIQFLTKIIQLYFIVLASFIISAFLNSMEIYYKTFQISYQYPIKSYIQVAKILLFIFAGILVVATILDKSPTYLFAGIGAMTAVILLIFRDSILGFVASIQLTAYDMIRIGDWVEMPAFGADGDVIDISLNTIKVQNFDKTIVTIPSYAFLSSGVKNWRGMNEAGGRRIKRSLYLDVNSIKFCDQTLLDRLKGIVILEKKLTEKLEDIATSNRQLTGDLSNQANGRQLTNIGVFRMYIEEYLERHPKIHKNMTLLVRQLQDVGKGIPLELYLFIKDTQWRNYEAIQADIFDHLYAVMPLFDLASFQYLSGHNLKVTLQPSEA